METDGDWPFMAISLRGGFSAGNQENMEMVVPCGTHMYINIHIHTYNIFIYIYNDQI